MFTRRIAFLAIALLFTFVTARFSQAQDATAQPPATQQQADPQAQQEEKLKLEKKAAALLEQVVSEAQGLKLPENRVRVQITAGDMLWDRDQARARGLFGDAEAGGDVRPGVVAGAQAGDGVAQGDINHGRQGGQIGQGLEVGLPVQRVQRLVDLDEHVLDRRAAHARRQQRARGHAEIDANGPLQTLTCP